MCVTHDRSNSGVVTLNHADYTASISMVTLHTIPWLHYIKLHGYAASISMVTPQPFTGYITLIPHDYPISTSTHTSLTKTCHYEQTCIVTHKVIL